MKFFGPGDDGEPMTRHPMGEVVSVPVGLSCRHCEEPIVDGDQGVVVPYFGESGDPDEVPYHRACFARQFTGPLAHVEKRCPCYGGDDREDPPGLTRREAAEAAFLAARRAYLGTVVH